MFVCRHFVATCLLFLVYALPLAGCGKVADSLFLRPERDSHQTPGALGLPYEEVLFPAADGVQLHGWWVPGESDQPTVLILQDGTGNASTQVDMLRQFRAWLPVNLFIFDYRGFGRSAGEPSDDGFAADVAGARQLLRARGWEQPALILYGKGIGAALAANSALAAPADGIVLEAAFPDLEAPLRARHPFLTSLLSPWLTGRFNLLASVKQLRAPVLFLHGDQDRQVPIGLGWQVFDTCKAPKRFRTIVGANHRDVAFVGGEVYWGAWRDLLAELGKVTRDGAPAAP